MKEVYFASTQMQARHEEFEEKEAESHSIKRKVATLDQFKRKQTPLETVTKQTRPIRLQTKPKARKNQTINSMVRESYSGHNLAYYSGDQTKIDDFLRRINQADDVSRLLPTTTQGQTFSKDEWTYILKSIKLRFPDLPRSGKTNLKRITTRINRYRNEEDSVWSQASSYPDISLTDDDLKWLYDLSEEQMANSSLVEDESFHEDTPLVFVLSQNPGHHTDDDEDELSEPMPRNQQEEEHTDYEDDELSHAIQRNQQQQEEEPTDDEIEVVLDSDSEIEELSILEIPESSKEASHQKESVFDPQTSFQSFPFAEIVDSPVKNESKKVTEFESPIKVTSFSQESPFKTPTKKTKILLNKLTPVEFSPVKIPVEEEIVISSEDEFYSTARSQIDSSIPVRKRIPQQKRKLLHTTRFEVQSDLHFGNYEDPEHKLKVRKIESRPICIDSDNEIPDSEDDSVQDVSIIEITREVEEEEHRAEVDDDEGNRTEDLIALGKEDGNTSVLQVPSSPSINGPVGSSSSVHSIQVGSSPSKNSVLEPASQFASLSTKELKEMFKTWDLKPVKSRQKMITVLSQTSKLVSESPASPIRSQSQREIRDSINARLNALIKLDVFWHEKVVSFEPLKLEQLQAWLEQRGYVLELDVLEKYADEMGICCTKTVY